MKEVRFKLFWLLKKSLIWNFSIKAHTEFSLLSFSNFERVDNLKMA